MGVNNSCACAITRTCESDDFGCNCDIMDGKTRTDFGILTDRWELPIWSMVFDDIGGSSSGRYRVGPLMCSDIEFGNFILIDFSFTVKVVTLIFIAGRGLAISSA